jgi:serine/threonine-protein kinase
MIGSRIGPYRILRQVNEDSLGQVFEAVDLARKKSVAIRALNNRIANRPDILARLRAEANRLALLNHPHIERTFGSIRDSERLFLVAEFLEGETLQSILKAKRGLEVPVALAYFHQLLSALAFAHNLGVIHGNLNPGNVLITHFGQLKVLDFARALLLRGQEPARVSDSEFYSSPEQLRGEPADERADLYSLGALFYQCLTGRRPFGCAQAMRAYGLGASTLLPPSFLTKNCPPWLDEFILRALAPAVADRFQTAAAMDRAMEARVRNAAPRAGWKQTSRRVTALAQTSRSAGSQLRRAERAAAARVRAITAGLGQACLAAARLGHDARAKMNLAESSRRWVLQTKSGLTAARTALQQARAEGLRNLQGQAAQARLRCREKASRFGFLANTAGSLLRARLTRRRGWTKSKIGDRTHVAGRNLATWMRDRVRPKFAASGWQRYAAFAILAASVTIEIFVFGGANALLVFERTPGPAIVQHGAAESFIEPAAENTVSPLRQIRVLRDQAPAPERPVNRASTVSKPSRSRSDKENDHLGARDAKRVVTYRTETKAPTLTERRASDPPRKRSDSPRQLNVKWEN